MIEVSLDASDNAPHSSQALTMLVPEDDEIEANIPPTLPRSKLSVFWEWMPDIMVVSVGFMIDAYDLFVIGTVLVIVDLLYPKDDFPYARMVFIYNIISPFILIEGLVPLFWRPTFRFELSARLFSCLRPPRRPVRFFSDYILMLFSNQRMYQPFTSRSTQALNSSFEC